MKFVSDSSKSMFQDFDKTDFALILIAIGLIAMSWPTSFFVGLIGMFTVPIWLMCRVVDDSARKII